MKSNFCPFAIFSAIILFVVIDALISIITGKLFVGKPIAIGFGVKRGSVPPKGATVEFEGTELFIIAIKPSSTIFFKYAASAPLW